AGAFRAIESDEVHDVGVALGADPEGLTTITRADGHPLAARLDDLHAAAVSTIGAGGGDRGHYRRPSRSCYTHKIPVNTSKCKQFSDLSGIFRRDRVNQEVTMDDPLLTPKQVGEILHVNERTIRKWLAAGTPLRGVWMGSDRLGWRIRTSELERYQ